VPGTGANFERRSSLVANAFFLPPLSLQIIRILGKTFVEPGREFNGRRFLTGVGPTGE
jgi:hypothetical protein